MWESSSSSQFANEHFTFVCRRPHSTLYYNVTDAGVCTCDASFEAQPDIAGVGTIVAFAILSIITIVAASIPAYYDSIVRFRSIRRAWRRRKLSRVGSLTRSKLPELGHAETNRNNVLARSFVGDDDLENYKAFQDSKPQLRTAEKVLGTLCDVQLFTTMSMLITAFALGDRLSYYHAQFVVNYYWFAVQSFWASRQNKWWEGPTENSLPQPNTSQHIRARQPFHRRLRSFFVHDEPFRLYLRRFLILACTSLFITIYARSIQYEATAWDTHSPGKCYRSKDVSDGPSDWFWLAGITVYDLVLLLSMVVFTKKVVAAFSNMLHASESSMFARCGHQWRHVRLGSASAHGGFLLRMQRVLWLSIIGLVSVVWCLAVQGATSMFFGDGVYLIEVIFYIGMWAWAFYDILNIKTSNNMLLVGNENSWTFGQILMLALIGFIAFAVLDAWETEERANVPRGPDTATKSENEMQT